MKQAKRDTYPFFYYRIAICFALLGAFSPIAHAVPEGIDHQSWDQLLQRYVDDRGLVDYQGWSNSEADKRTLQRYLEQFAPADRPQAEGDAEIASLINAYNAFTIQFVLQHFPTESIRLLDSPFDGKRHLVDGEAISLDDIEHERLRPLIGWKVHSTVVCAARSCPPLLNRAYFADHWEDKMHERYRTWLGRGDLNRFLPERKRAEVSKIFDWYGEDFESDHSVKAILGRYGPEPHQDFLQSGDYRIRFLDYHWGLNAQSDHGADYTHSIWRSLF